MKKLPALIGKNRQGESGGQPKTYGRIRLRSPPAPEYINNSGYHKKALPIQVLVKYWSHCVTFTPWSAPARKPINVFSCPPLSPCRLYSLLNDMLLVAAASRIALILMSQEVIKKLHKT